MSRSQERSVEMIRARVREAGLRCTKARLAVLAHLTAARGPQTHAEVSQSLAHCGFDRATIYRNLTELTQANILTRVDLGDHVWRFEWRQQAAAADHPGDHPHFVCTTCGEVSCLDGIDVAITARPGTKKTVQLQSRREGGPASSRRPRAIREVKEVLLKGTCENCE